MSQQARDLAARIEHTLLKPQAQPADVDRLCDEAVAYGFAGVCVMPYYVPRAAARLAGRGVRVVTVVGFPLGAHRTSVKAAEARDAVAAGADELDMVLQVGALKAGDDAAVEEDIAAVVAAAAGRPVKVILETALLTDEEIVRGCRIAERAGARYVKTSTGFGPGGATAEHVALMRRTVGSRMGVKAAGGIRTAADAWRMLRAGADRIGTSNGVAIVTAGAGDASY